MYTFYIPFRLFSLFKKDIYAYDFITLLENSLLHTFEFHANGTSVVVLKMFQVGVTPIPLDKMCVVIELSKM